MVLAARLVVTVMVIKSEVIVMEKLVILVSSEVSAHGVCSEVSSYGDNGEVSS